VAKFQLKNHILNDLEERKNLYFGKQLKIKISNFNDFFSKDREFTTEYSL